MSTISYRRHRFPPETIQHTVWLYFRFSLSFRDVEDLLTERGIDVSYETVRRWAMKFGLTYARKLRRSRPRPDGRWHLDEMFVSVDGKRQYLWRRLVLGNASGECSVSNRLDQRNGSSRPTPLSTTPSMFNAIWFPE